MIINVKPEGREDVYLVEKEDIIKYIENLEQEHIHNYNWNGWSMLIWADWGKEWVIENINNSDKVAILLWKAKANNMWHSLAVVNNTLWLEIFDINIDINNLLIK